MWRKSTKSDNGCCLEFAFRRSSRCDSSACLEVAHRDQVLVRDSKRGEDGPVLAFDPGDWTWFLGELPERYRS